MRGRLVALAIAAASLVAAPAAFAGTLTRNGSTLVFTAAPGEANNLQVGAAGDRDTYDIVDSGVPITYDPSAGCDLDGTCHAPGVNAFTASLGDGDDQFTGSLPFLQTIDGGDGNDKLSGAGTLHGGPGNDRLQATANPPGVVDYEDGGPGDDGIRLNSRGITIDCTGGGNDSVGDLVDPTEVKLIGCGPPPKVSIAVSRVKLGGLLHGKLVVTIACDRPCDLEWAIQGANRKTKRSIPRACACILQHSFARESDLAAMTYAPAGPQVFPVTRLGTGLTRTKGVKSFKFNVVVLAQSNLGVTARAHKLFTVKR